MSLLEDVLLGCLDDLLFGFDPFAASLVLRDGTGLLNVISGCIVFHVSVKKERRRQRKSGSVLSKYDRAVSDV